MLQRSALHDGEQVRHPLQEQLGGILEDASLGGVEHVRRRQAVVHPLAALRHRFGEYVDERSDVVVGDPLAFVPFVDIHLGGSAGSGGCRLRGDPFTNPRLDDEGLDFLPYCEFVRFAPDRRHLGERIAGDHPFRPSR